MKEKLENVNLSCVVSGSFRKYYSRILSVITILLNSRVQVLSPKSSKIIDPSKGFVILETDLHDLSSPVIRHIEGKVLRHIRECDFLYVCNPEGYIGLSTAFEIGFAHAHGKKIITSDLPTDSTIFEFVDQVCSPDEAVVFIQTSVCQQHAYDKLKEIYA